jgi:hypothetical protein
MHCRQVSTWTVQATHELRSDDVAMTMKMGLFMHLDFSIPVCAPLLKDLGINLLFQVYLICIQILPEAQILDNGTQKLEIKFQVAQKLPHVHSTNINEQFGSGAILSEHEYLLCTRT